MNNQEINLLAISGSVRDESYNLALLHAMAELAPQHVHVSIFENIKNIPLFNPDIEEENFPESINDLIAQLKSADGVIISTPEYAHGITGALKNLLDWLVASDVLILKPIAVTSVSTSGLGGVRAHSPLVLVLTAMNTRVIVQSSLNIPHAKAKFDKHNKLQDDLTKQAIKVSLLALEQAITNSQQG